MNHPPITTQREWSAHNQSHVLAATGRVLTFFLKSAVLVSMSLFIGFVFAWYF